MCRGVRLNFRASWTLFVPVAACALLALWMAASAARLQTANFSLLVYALSNLIVFSDALDFALRMYVCRRLPGNASGTSPRDRLISGARQLSIDLAAAARVAACNLHAPVRPFAIVASVFNLENQLEAFMEAFLPYRDRVWLISDGSTDHTVERLRQAGWRCIDDGVNRHKPGALRCLLETLPAQIETVMTIDPDMRIRGSQEGSTLEFERVVAEFQQSGAAAACPRIMIEEDGFLGRFQAFEYALTFGLGRCSLADYVITSGVALYRRDALTRALSRHSLSVYAEDLENAAILLGEGEQIYYDGRLVVSTEGPASWRYWFSQRIGWFYGLIKVYSERFQDLWRISARSPFAAYQYLLYIGGLTLALHPFKVLGVMLLWVSFANGLDHLFGLGWLPDGGLTNRLYFTAAAAKYLVLGSLGLFAVVPRRERAYVAPIMPLYLLYAMAHVVPMTIGFGNWFALRLWGRRLYRDHYQADDYLIAASRAGQFQAEHG